VLFVDKALRMDSDSPSKKRKSGIDGGATQLHLPLLSEALNECEQLRSELNQLRQENAQLRAEQLRLIPDSPAVTVSEPKSIYQEKEPVPSAPVASGNSRIKLFQSLFRARDDVYAERWQKKDGTSNYSPAKLHQWDSHTKNERGKWQCGPGCQLLPLTEQVLQEHLKGQRTVGIYPLLKDETCWLLAVDFDDNEWSDDALAFLETCDAVGVPAYLERSRSGAGGHVWIFFDGPVRAAQARALGAFLISETKQNRYQIGFKSYDRMFPNQDTMPRGGYGNLIALPLQLESSNAGNSVFVDRDLHPFEDQWTYLGSVVRLRSTDLDSIVRDASAREAILTVPLSSNDPDSEEPWKKRSSGKPPDKKLKEPYPKELEIVLSNMIYFPKAGFSSAALSKVMGIAAFQNPEFYQKQATRQSTHDTPRIICCAENLDKYIALPRSCLDNLKEHLVESGITHTEVDERFGGNAISANFKGQLRDEQSEAVKQILSSDLGVLSASTAFGKTVVAAYIIGERKTNTLILVHTLPLIDQWKEKLEQFLDMPPKSVGQIGGGKKSRTGLVDIATIQSLGRKGLVSDIVSEYGQIIVDECHHISAFSFEQVVKKAKAKYVLGLTATPVRKDGHQPIIMMQCGPVKFKDSLRNRKLSGVRHVVIPRETGFQMPTASQDGTHIHELYDALAINQQRNDLIFDDILKELDQGRSPLVITERLEHLDGLATKLQGFAKNIIVLKGGMTKKERSAIFTKLKAIPNDAERLILATGKYIGEGFDDARLDTLFLLLPISFEGRVEQYAGRLHREHAGKTDVRIYDYLDSSHPILKKMFERRCVKYRKLGYEIGSELSTPYSKRGYR
jgi:superfamily II DNA or RNA helicase